MKTPSFIFFSIVLLVSILTGVLSKPYFTDRVFYLHEDVYKFAGAQEQDQLITYHSSMAEPIQVRIDDELHRTVVIGKQSYSIADKTANFSTSYRVTYPNGHTYKVEDNAGLLLSYDDKGNFLIYNEVYIGGERVPQPGEEDFPPSALVTAAYPDYHIKRGMPGFLFLALGMLIYGWCGFQYRKFQDWTFRLSPQRLNYVDPEPSDFYYFMCKVGGLAVMAGAVFIAFKAF
ncbi:hypothetical protein GZH47_17220 [Paenibacillus rhizovicinus]|uniref:DUF6199 domain-containing protein n=1 Tax=Paenibacillus rhizovicinus TaxID=2704463 RepID=A0A6C0P1M0_9BACL|nr:hypothetical protein [Paenibacillus rhizovicinus]QHW32378.1 hypothetical protein GZH47_17220 [Paenibacillus rhizovicinus]